MTRTVLTIEDDASIRRGIVDALQYAGYQIHEAANGDDGLRKAIQLSLDLILLDLVLPGMNGLEILKGVRRVRPTLPIIMLTAKGDEDSRVEGLKNGADDYVIKPFSVRELLARVEAVMRRSPQRPVDLDSHKIPDGKIDFQRREIAFDDGQRHELSEKEVELIRYLTQNRGRAIAREELLSSVWRISPDGVATRTIDMHVARLREKLRDDPAAPQILLTVRGKGYMFCADEPSA
jgi:DNA-binding response OmpR family regulator